MSRFRRRLMGLTQLREAKRNDFVRVEYIENTSSAYINTGVNVLNSKYFDIDISFSVLNRNNYIIGQRKKNDTITSPANTMDGILVNTSNNFETGVAMTDANNSDYIVEVDKRYRISGNYKNVTVTYTEVDEETSEETQQSFTITNGGVYTNNHNRILYLFNINQPKFNTANAMYGKMYGCKLYNGTVLLRDFIPMYQISTDTYGLWDRVEKKFYTSPNGVKFTGGRQIIYDAEIEYLRGTYPQYIDTGIIPNNSTGIYVKAYRDAGNDNFVIGCRNNAGNTRWAIGRMNSGWYYGWGRLDSSGIMNSPADIYLNYKNDRLFKVTATDGTKTLSLSSLSFTPAYNIRLFGAAGTSGIWYKWNGRIYAVQITQGTEIIMDLIPVRVGNVGYMYDKVSNKLFGNNGSGSFILGQDTVVYDKI